MQNKVAEKVQRSKKKELEAQNPPPNADLETPAKFKGITDEVKKLLGVIKDIIDEVMVALPGLMDGNKGMDSLERSFKVCLARCPQAEELLEKVGFDIANGKFTDVPQWSTFPSTLIQYRNTVEHTLTELESLGTKGRVGRPYGRSGTKRTPSRSPDCDSTTTVPPSSTGQGSSASSKKRRQKSAQPEAGDGEDVDKDDMGGLSRNLFDDYDPGDSDGEDGPNKNKASSIPLCTKCTVVELGKRLKAEGCHNVEKEVMLKFKKLFWSDDKQRFKTGLLRKWTQIPGSRYSSFFRFLEGLCWSFVISQSNMFHFAN